jgi:hypothetical protein
MLKRVLVVSLVLGTALVASLHADVRYTMRVEVRETGGAAEASSPLLPLIRKQLVSVIVPGGVVEYALAAGDAGARIEFRNATAGIPAGGILLAPAEGQSVVLDPAERTYWTVTRASRARPSSPFIAEAPPARTGEAATISGVRAERVTFSVRLVPPPSSSILPDEVLEALQLDGELWVTDEVRVPRPVTDMVNPMLQLLGLETVVGDGFVVRQVLRGPLLGSQEIETLVTGIDSTPLAPEQLRVPEGYRQVTPGEAAEDRGQ